MELQGIATAQEIIAVAMAIIDEEMNNPSERIMLKLYLNNYAPDEIACLAGMSPEGVRQVLATGRCRLERRMGCSLDTVQIVCTRWRLGLS